MKNHVAFTLSFIFIAFLVPLFVLTSCNKDSTSNTVLTDEEIPDVADELRWDEETASDADTSECVGGEWKTETGVVSQCVKGSWVVRRITHQWGTSAALISESGSSVAVDKNGNIYVSGQTDGAFDGNVSPKNGQDAFLSKWNKDWKTREWTEQWGAESSAQGNSVVVDGNGNIYVAGNVYRWDVDREPFLSKWDSDGTNVWEKQWGTASEDHALSAALDAAGNIYVTGYTLGALDGNVSKGAYDIFLTKWDAGGTKAWTTQWGTNDSDMGHSVAVDRDGNIYVTGETHASLESANQGYGDIFLTKLKSDGTIIWTRQWGTIDADRGHAVAVDDDGNIYVTGQVWESLDGNDYGGLNDIFLTKWNPDGAKAWTRQWGTNDLDHGNSVTVDKNGDIYVTGETDSSLDGNASSGSTDIFLTKWDSDGTKVWTKQWGTGTGEVSRSVAVDGNGNIYLTGWTWGPLDGTVNEGYGDIFLTILPAE